MIQLALAVAVQPQVGAVLTVKEPKPAAAVNDCPGEESEYVQGARKLALITGGVVPELTVNGLVVVVGPPLTVAE